MFRVVSPTISARERRANGTTAFDSAAAEATELPIAKQRLGLVDRQALVPYRLRYVDGAHESEALAVALNLEQEVVGERVEMRFTLARALHRG